LPDARTIALVLLAGLAAVPYVNGYDLALAAPALTLALFGEGMAVSGVAGTLLWLLPPLIIPFGLLQVPLVQPLFSAALVVALLGADRTRISRPDLDHEGLAARGRPL